jgi:hypothetical protein
VGLSTKASDWWVYGEAAFAGGAIASAGMYWFLFYSDTAGLCARFRFAGVGLGAGGNGIGLSIPGASNWSQLSCDSAFSVWDLHLAPGDVTGIGASIGAGYSYISIGAYKGNTWLFSDQSVGGFGGGSIGLSLVSMTGRWKYLGQVILADSA